MELNHILYPVEKSEIFFKKNCVPHQNFTFASKIVNFIKKNFFLNVLARPYFCQPKINSVWPYNNISTNSESTMED